MEVKIKSYNNIDSLEFGVLKELPKLRIVLSLEDGTNSEDKFSLYVRNFGKITNFDNIFEVLYKVDEKIICFNNDSKFLVIDNYPKINTGELYLSYDDYDKDDNSINKIYKINQELLDDKKFNELFIEIDKWVEESDNKDNWGNSREYNQHLINKDNIGEEGLTPKLIVKELAKHKKEQEKVEVEQKKEEEVKVVEEKAIENEDEKLYNSKGEGNFGGYSVEKNIIKGERVGSFVLDKDVNKTFSYEQIKYISSADTILSSVEGFLNNKGVSYIKIKNDTEKYNVVYDSEGKCKINEVDIPKAKIRFILNRVSDGYKQDIKKQDIEILIKLNGMKVDFVGLETIRCNDLEIPIYNTAISDKTFKIKFINKTQFFNWDKVKRLFFDDGRSRSVNSWMGDSQIMNFCSEMGVEKKDLFSTMKRVKMLDSLKSEEDN